MDVVEVDENALEEYSRRLVSTYQARQATQEEAGTTADWVWTLPSSQSTTTIALHCGDARRMPPTLGQGYDLAVLDFSASQIVRGWSDVEGLLHALCIDRGIPRVCLVVHDHVFAGPPPPGCGVHCVVLETPACVPAGHAGWCRCEDGSDHGATRLETTVVGTSMARGITEYVFDGAAFVREAERLVSVGDLPPWLTVRLRRPFDAKDHHWLLRSLALIRVECDPCTT